MTQGLQVMNAAMQDIRASVSKSAEGKLMQTLAKCEVIQHGEPEGKRWHDRVENESLEGLKKAAETSLIQPVFVTNLRLALGELTKDQSTYWELFGGKVVESRTPAPLFLSSNMSYCGSEHQPHSFCRRTMSSAAGVSRTAYSSFVKVISGSCPHRT